MNDHCPFPNLFAYRDTSRAFAKHSFSLSFVPQEMSLNIDINRILPVGFSGVSPNLYSKLLTSSLSCNVLNPGKIFHSNSIGSQSILSMFLQFWEDFTHPNLCSHASLDSGFSKIFPRHNTESEKNVDLRALRLMTLSSPINDIYFHEWFSQPTVSKPEISSCPDTNFADMSNICFSVRSAVFTMELRLFWKFFPVSTADSIVTVMNISQIIECSSPFSVTLEILFCLFRTWSFTRFTNDLDSTNNSNSASSFPMTNCWGHAPSWESISRRPYLSRSVSSYLTDCVVPSRRISSWSGRTCCTTLQEVLSSFPDRSCAVTSLFHSWEDQAWSSSNFE